MNDNFMDYLQEHGLEIGRAAKNGNLTAQYVIDWYVIWQKAPGDNGAKTVLIEMINHYRKESEAKS